MSRGSSFKSRFCPSPTGLMHLGNLRTALFNYLLSKANKGRFLLRIEDTDLARSQAVFTEGLMSTLKWMKINWDDGPYFQSQRQEIYEAYYQELIESGRAYWCFCQEAELTIMRKTQLAAGHAPRYPGTCRHLTPEQIEGKKNQGLKPALRIKVPDGEKITFEDFIQGPKVFATDDIGDFIIKKADGSASFMFCNAVDDALMEVTHVMRGEDHLTNTPRQLFILEALKLKAPLYGHMALILGFDGKPLSKRNGSQSVESLQEQGFFAISIANYLARLGHHFESDDLLTFEALGENFSIDHINRAPARFDMAQLNHWQKEAVLTLSDEQCWEWIAPSVGDWVERDKHLSFTQTVKQNILFPADAQFWAKQLLSAQCHYSKEAKEVMLEAGIGFLEALMRAVEQEGDDYGKAQKMLSELTHKKGKALFKPLRASITGRVQGPELVKIFALMGKTGLLERLAMVHEGID